MPVDQFLGGSEGLLSVPIDSRPRQSELRPYLKNLQSHVLILASDAIERCDDNPNVLAPVRSDLTRLITALSTETKFIRIPVIWSIWKSLTEEKSAANEITIERVEALEIVDELNSALGIFLSHFDLSEHLSEAYTRKIAGDDTVDTAFFLELAHRVEEFDTSRADVFSDEMERAKRISSVLRLPSGVVPRITYLGYKFFSSAQSLITTSARYLSAMAVGFVLADTSGLLTKILHFLKAAGLPL